MGNFGVIRQTEGKYWCIYAGDAHPRFAIITWHANGLVVDCWSRDYRQLSGSFIGWIINRFYGKCGIHWYVSDTEANAYEAISRSSLIIRHSMRMLHGHSRIQKIYYYRKGSLMPSIAHSIKAFNGSMRCQLTWDINSDIPGHYFE